MKYRMINKWLFALSVLAFAYTGCTPDEQEAICIGSPEPEGKITFSVDIPNIETPATRSIAGSDGESIVESIDLLVFKSNGPGNPEILTECVAGENITQSTSSSDNYKVQFKGKLTVEATASTVVVLANIPTATIAALPPAGTDKQTVLEALKHSSTGKWNATSSANYTSIPMYGERAVGGITAGMTISGVELTRMLARIDVVNNAANFTLSDVYLVNYNTGGYIAPAWNGADGRLLTPSDLSYPYTNNTNAPLPANANPQLGEINALTYDYTSASSNGLVGEIYTYEASKSDGVEGAAGHTNAICLVVKGKVAGDSQDYFYRIDFTSGRDANGFAPGDIGFNPSTVVYMPVYRNYRYTFDLGSVDGGGCTSFDDALNSLGLKSNLKTSLLVVDESSVNDFVFDSRYYLGLADAATVGFTAGSTADVLCVTNYIQGWEFDTSIHTNGIEYISGSGWLQANKENSGDIKRANIELTTLQTNSTAAYEAYIHIKAGKLAHKLKVIQDFSTFTISTSHTNGAAINATGESFGVTVTGLWSSVMVRAWDGNSVVSTSTPSITAGTGTDTSMSIDVDVNASWSARTVRLEYSSDGGTSWKLISTGGQGAGNNITAASFLPTGFNPATPTSVTVSITGTYPANTVEVRAYSVTGDSILVNGGFIATTQSASAGTVVLTIPENPSWTIRNIQMQYYDPGTNQWKNIGSSTNQGGYSVSASATQVTNPAGGNSTVTITGFRPLIYVRAMSNLSSSQPIATRTVAAATTGSATAYLSISRATENRFITISWSHDNTNWNYITSFWQYTNIRLTSSGRFLAKADCSQLFTWAEAMGIDQTYNLNVYTPVSSSMSATYGPTTRLVGCGWYSEPGYPAGKWFLANFKELEEAHGLNELNYVNGIYYWCAMNPPNGVSAYFLDAQRFVGSMGSTPKREPMKARCVRGY